ncbi:MAG TPA: TerB family tellurite resistance protein [Kofleriaceae bacterium]|nr:TerB family tellurite resistance protein [Kofleriaceae bacterium]
MSISDRILPLCELLLGAAYADKELKDQEKDKVRELLEELSSDLPTDVELKLVSFDPKGWNMKEAAHAFTGDSEDDRKKVLQLVAAVNEADDELDIAEDEYLRNLAGALGLPASALAGMTVEVEAEDLKPIFEKVRKGPPPPPKAKEKSVDVDMD